MGTYSSVAVAGCGVAAVGLLLFTGCGGGERPDPPGTEAPGAPPTGTPGLTTVSIPEVSPPSRSSSSVETEVCGIPGVPCTEPTTTDSESSEPPAESSEPQPSEPQPTG